METKTFENNQSYNSKAIYHINEAVHFYRRVTIFVGILSIIFAFAYIWSYKYMKYLNSHKTELINVKNYNRTLFWTDLFN